jgi:hypothetical protein
VSCAGKDDLGQRFGGDFGVCTEEFLFVPVGAHAYEVDSCGAGSFEGGNGEAAKVRALPLAAGVIDADEKLAAAASLQPRIELAADVRVAKECDSASAALRDGGERVSDEAVGETRRGWQRRR